MVATSQRSVGPASPTTGRSVSSFRDQISLTDTNQGTTDWYKVPPGRSLVSVTIEVTDGEVWSSGTIVEPQWSLMPRDADHSFAVTYEPVVQFTSLVNSRPAISVLGRGNFRLKTTTATSGDDPAAKVLLEFF